MTEEKMKDVAKDATWDRAQSVIRARIMALRERQAAEQTKEKE